MRLSMYSEGSERDGHLPLVWLSERNSSQLLVDHISGTIIDNSRYTSSLQCTPPSLPELRDEPQQTSSVAFDQLHTLIKPALRGTMKEKCFVEQLLRSILAACCNWTILCATAAILSEVDMVAAGDLLPYFWGNTDLVYALLSLPEC